MSAGTPEVMTITYANKRPSEWVLDGTENSGTPVRLDSPASYRISLTSAIKVPDPETKGGWLIRRTRYIKDSDTYFVDEQDKRGIKPNPVRDMQDLYVEGNKTIVRAGATKVLYDFIHNHASNKDAPNPPDSRTIRFEELKSEKIAEAGIPTFDERLEAMQYLNGLKLSETAKGTTYKEREIDFLVKLFELPGRASYPERFILLAEMANNKPKKFLQAIGDKKSAVMAEIQGALQMKVIQFDKSKAMLLNGNRVLLNTQAKNEGGQIEELAVYFLSGSGEKNYVLFSDEFQAAKEAVTAIQH